jgi:hypothetical protein
MSDPGDAAAEWDEEFEREVKGGEAVRLRKARDAEG